MEEDKPSRSCSHGETQPQPEPRHDTCWHMEKTSQPVFLSSCSVILSWYLTLAESTKQTQELSTCSKFFVEWLSPNSHFKFLLTVSYSPGDIV